jgi:hypothetical protein
VPRGRRGSIPRPLFVNLAGGLLFFLLGEILLLGLRAVLWDRPEAPEERYKHAPVQAFSNEAYERIAYVSWPKARGHRNPVPRAQGLPRRLPVVAVNGASRSRGRLASTGPEGSSNSGGVGTPSLSLDNVTIDCLGYFLRALAFEEISLERHQVGSLQNAVGVEDGGVDAVEITVTVALHLLELQPPGLLDSPL